jgi:hypothetical protein
MAIHTFTLDEESVGVARDPSVFSSREMLNEVLRAIPQDGDVVHVTVVMGPLFKSRGARLYQRQNVTYEVAMKNKTGVAITADAKREELS